MNEMPRRMIPWIWIFHCLQQWLKVLPVEQVVVLLLSQWKKMNTPESMKSRINLEPTGER